VAIGAGALFAWRFVAAGATPLPDPADPATTLDRFERAVFRAQPVPEMTSPALVARLGAPWLGIYDLRGAEAHAAGHIPGAIAVSPFLSPIGFRDAHGGSLAGRIAVFVDLAGDAIGAFIARLRPTLGALRPLETARLRGGMLRWWAEGHALAGAGALHLPDAGWAALAARASVSSRK
jgi:hypothetical protein